MKIAIDINGGDKAPYEQIKASIKAIKTMDAEIVFVGKREYVEKYLTIDNDFFAFAEKYHKEYDFVLLSTDVSEWSKYITEYYELDKYFKHKIISGDVHLRKPDKAIYELTLDRIGRKPEECLFIDDSVANIQQAAELGIKTVLFTGFDDAYNFIVSSTNS